MARLLILTLNSGESALPTLVRQLAEQSFRDFEHEVISGLPNKVAHNLVYRTIQEKAPSFDLFLKLDADMTLRTDAALAEAVRVTDCQPDVQHFAFDVWDFFTHEETLGVHIFRSGVRWGEITDDLFVDPDPPDVRQVLWKGPPAPFVNHGEVVSDFECFAFGVHKFLKAVQRGRTGRGPQRKRHKYVRHMRNCVRIRQLYRETHARRHQLALAGVIWAMEQPGVTAVPSKSALRDVFEGEFATDDPRWQRLVDRLAHSPVAWRLALLRALGPRLALA
jgi:hypothetical protein